MDPRPAIVMHVQYSYEQSSRRFTESGYHYSSAHDDDVKSNGPVHTCEVGCHDLLHGHREERVGGYGLPRAEDSMKSDSLVLVVRIKEN